MGSHQGIDWKMCLLKDNCEVGENSFTLNGHIVILFFAHILVFEQSLSGKLCHLSCVLPFRLVWASLIDTFFGLLHYSFSCVKLQIQVIKNHKLLFAKHVLRLTCLAKRIHLTCIHFNYLA